MPPSIYPQTASCRLNIIVVGCGLGGLAAAWCLGEAGHSVTVLEAASSIGEIGAGIQIAPNLTRLLLKWGLADRLKDVVVLPEAVTFRSWKTGERLGWTKWGDRVEKDYGAPYYHIHRADLHAILYDLASKHMQLHLNARVVSISFDPSSHQPSVKLADGAELTADVVIGADGVKSTLRELVVGHPDKPVPTGDAAYRSIIKAEDMLKDSLLKELIEFPEMMGWIGPGRHIMAYCIRQRKEYNIVMLHPDDGSIESWTAEGSAEKMRAEFVGWEPRIQKLLALVPSTLRWKLMDREPLETWVHPEGTLALLGDACHPMLPYRAQGSAMAVEDAAVLGNLFSHVCCRSQIPTLLHAYQKLRFKRTAETQASSRLNQSIFHLPDGEAQQKRDRKMILAMIHARKEAGMPLESYPISPEDISAADNEKGFGNPNQWADKAKNLDQFCYDADAEADKWWREEGETLTRGLEERHARL